MLEESPLPGDMKELERKHSIRTANEKKALRNVLNDFFKFENSMFLHSRCDEDIISYRDKSAKASKSAKKRWEKDANAVRTHSEGNANHKPTTINHKPITNKDFERFYAAYPKKKSKPLALKAWLKHKPDINVVLKSLIMHKKCDQWTKNKGEFIPYPASWLNAEGWNDEIETKKVNSTYASFIK